MNISELYQKNIAPNLSGDMMDPPPAGQAVLVYLLYLYLDGSFSSELEEMYRPAYMSVSRHLDAVALSRTAEDDHTLDYLFVIQEGAEESFFQNVKEWGAACLNDISVINAGRLADKAALHHTERVKSIGEEMDAPFAKARFVAKILCLHEPDGRIKSAIRKKLLSLEGEDGTYSFEMVYPSDIESAYESATGRSEWVEEGSVSLYSKDSGICWIDGDAEGEGSFLCTLSAFSLKSLYEAYGKRGLFAANLRYYVKNKKIDPAIRDTILTKPEKFVYFNNGIIIVCSDYMFDPEDPAKINLADFSIVNGCQTTSLIGGESFAVDFPVVAKIVRINTNNPDVMIGFIADVAEASNSQKPIKAKDLIANRPEQRRLKEQFRRAKMFLVVKRGDHVSPLVYSRPWQKASNDELGQMLYSIVFQHPGAAKTSKSALLSNETRYKEIYSPTYSDQFLVSLQKIKVAYKMYQSRERKGKPKRGDIRFGVVLHSDLLVLAVIGLYIKLHAVPGMADIIRQQLVLKPDFFVTPEFRNLVGKCDIGQSRILKVKAEEDYDHVGEIVLFPLFAHIIDAVLEPAYRLYLLAVASPSPNNFSKTDVSYPRYVVRLVWELFLKGDPVLDNFLSLERCETASASLEDPRVTVRTDLDTELRDMVEEMLSEDKRGRGKRPNPLSGHQRSEIERLRPKSYEELRGPCNLSPAQVDLFGEAILALVRKYASEDGF